MIYKYKNDILKFNKTETKFRLANLIWLGRRNFVRGIKELPAMQ